LLLANQLFLIGPIFNVKSSLVWLINNIYGTMGTTFKLI
jgi:hypothetical protein